MTSEKSRTDAGKGRVNYGRVFTSPVLTVVDSVISLCIVAPLVVGYWRGTWFLVDILLFPNNMPLSCWSSVIIGFGILLIATWFQDVFHRISSRQNRILYFLISRFYTVVMCLGCVNHWRGVWATLDHYTGSGWLSSSVTLVIGVVGLILLRAFRNIMAPPMVIIVDSPRHYFTFPTMFRQVDSKTLHLKILDGVFTVAVVGSLVVFVWRAMFQYLDSLMFPGNDRWSAWGSTILGYSTSILAFSLQLPLVSFCARVDGFWRIVVVDIFTAIASLGSINVWRGLWKLYDLYLLPENQTLSCWLTHGAGLVLLSLCYCAHSILVRGVYLDAEEPGPAAGILPCFYLRYLTQKEEVDNELSTTGKSDEGERKRESKRPLENGWTSEETETMISHTPNHHDKTLTLLREENEEESAI